MDRRACSAGQNQGRPPVLLSETSSVVEVPALRPCFECGSVRRLRPCSECRVECCPEPCLRDHTATCWTPGRPMPAGFLAFYDGLAERLEGAAREPAGNAADSQ